MIRGSTRIFPPLVRTRYKVAQHFRSVTSQPRVPDEASEEEHAAARTWLSKFRIHSIPRKLCEITFSRSSGPGGQSVNKVNSKATVRLPMKDLLPLVPTILHQQIQESRFHAERSNALVIQADGSRKQGDNVEEAFTKLRDLIIAAGKKSVRGESSPEQVQKAKNLQKAGNEARLRLKKSHSSKKAARKSSRPTSY